MNSYLNAKVTSLKDLLQSGFSIHHAGMAREGLWCDILCGGGSKRLGCCISVVYVAQLPSALVSLSHYTAMHSNSPMVCYQTARRAEPFRIPVEDVDGEIISSRDIFLRQRDEERGCSQIAFTSTYSHVA